jgi:heme exporter protein C
VAVISYFANPQRFMRLSEAVLPFAAILATLLLSVGLTWGLVFSPEDAVQHQAVRILYVHVPAAWWSLSIYAFMAGASFVSIVWRHVLADVAARAAAPIGAAYAALCLVTGSLYGAPTWGTWWVWDARLTSMLILFLTYLGYIALWTAIEDEGKAARLAAILCLAGAINLPIVHFSVTWWNTLHQPASILRAGGSAMYPSMLQPLLVSAAGYGVAFLALLLAGMRTEVFRRRASVRAGA